MLNKSVGELMEENSQLVADKLQSDKVSLIRELLCSLLCVFSLIQLAESRKNLLDDMSKEHQDNLKSLGKRHEVFACNDFVIT